MVDKVFGKWLTKVVIRFFIQDFLYKPVHIDPQKLSLARPEEKPYTPYWYVLTNVREKTP